MATVEAATYFIITRFRNTGIAQVTGYNALTYIRETDNAIIKRENRSEAKIPIDYNTPRSLLCECE